MKKNTVLKGIHRRRLLEELYNRYSQPISWRMKLRYLRKKYLWIFLVEGTRFIKRVLDLTIATTLLIATSPLMFVITLLIKWIDKAPPIYKTARVGKWGKEFSFPKFRTMKINADTEKAMLINLNKHSNDKKFKMIDDPRITPFGYYLRKTSLDELPQLWCVIKGDMSLVGPRPPLPDEVAKYTIAERKRLDTIPGLTCIWQVSGRSEIPFKEQVELDVAYIESQSLWLDLKLIIKTIPAIFLGKGAY